MNSDRVFVMGEKRVIEEGRPTDLLNDQNSQFQYYVKKMQDTKDDTKTKKWCNNQKVKSKNVSMSFWIIIVGRS